MAVLNTLTINGTTYNVTSVVPASYVTLLASAWVGDGDAYSQVVNIPGVTAHTKVDLQPTSEQLAEFHYRVLAFVAENDGGVVTVYAIGDKPTKDYTIQVTKTEVEGVGRIRGNTVGTTMPRPDWNQDDPRKADYIRNKPPGTLIVTATDGTASHNAEEIYAHVQNGGTAFFDAGGFLVGLQIVDEWRVQFGYTSDDGYINAYIIYDDGNVEEYEAEYLRRDDSYQQAPVVAYFYSRGGGSEYRCETHTARQLANLIRNGKVVIARLDDWENQRKGFAFMGVDESGFIKIWDSFTQDAGWSHAPDTAGFYADDDLDNKTAGNELWVEY